MANVTEEDLVVQPSDMALMNVAALHASGSLDLSPRFQRRNRWDRERQSQLIESFILNVPVPAVYLAEESKGVFAVIDGKQRLTAIVQFLNDEFRLTRLGLRRDLEGARFSDLPSEVAATLRMRPIRAVTIMRQTPDWVKHEVFVRLNRGGQPLNAQEIRNVAFAGLLNDRIIELAEHPFLASRLKITGPSSSAYATMANVEIVVRFFAIAETWQTFSGDFSEALDDFMLRHHEASPSEVEEFAGRFNRAIRWCAHLWGDNAFRRWDGAGWRDQMIGGVYDAEMVAVDCTPEFVLERLDPAEVLLRTRALFQDYGFDTSVRQNTNTSTRVRYRIAQMIEALSN